jgi:hypothetical protein
MSRAAIAWRDVDLPAPWADCASFQASACSRPPPPMTSTFMLRCSALWNTFCTSSRSSMMSRSFCMRAASSPVNSMVFSGRMVTSATSGLSPRRLQRVLHFLEIRIGDVSTSIAPSASVMTSSAPASSATSMTLSSLRPRGKDQLPAMLELESDRALRAHVAAVLAERVPHVGHGANPVVGHGVHDDGRAADAIALVADLLVVDAFEVAGGLVDVALDGFDRDDWRPWPFRPPAAAGG